METDASLVDRSLMDDPTAFDLLLRRHFRASYEMAMTHLDTPEAAEGACIAAFERAWKRLDECRYPDRFAEWLLTIVRNEAHNRRNEQLLTEGFSRGRRPTPAAGLPRVIPGASGAAARGEVEALAARADRVVADTIGRIAGRGEPQDAPGSTEWLGRCAVPALLAAVVSAVVAAGVVVGGSSAARDVQESLPLERELIRWVADVEGPSNGQIVAALAGNGR